MPNLKSFKYRDPQGFYLDSVLASPTVLAAKRDPEGTRAALMVYGSLVDFHGGMIPPIVTFTGEANWQRSIDLADPQTLGIAWLNAESEVPEWKETPMDMDTKPTKQTTKKQETKMSPVIEWKEAAGPVTKPGYYKARIDTLTEVEGKFGPQLQFEFRILDETNEDTDSTVRGWCGLSWTPRSKLLTWAKVLLRGKCPVPPAPMNSDLLLGKRCDIELIEGNAMQDGSGYWTKLSGVLYPYNTVSNEAPDEDDEEPAAFLREDAEKAFAARPALKRREEAFPV